MLIQSFRLLVGGVGKISGKTDGRLARIPYS